MERLWRLELKFAHFVDFTPVTAESVSDEGDRTVYSYSLAEGQVYNYRASLAGGLTHAGYFTMAGCFYASMLHYQIFFAHFRANRLVTYAKKQYNIS